MAKTKTGVNLYINGTKHNASPIPENGDSYNISDVVNPGDSFTIQESYAYDDLSESGKSILQTLTLDFKTVLTPAQTSIPYLYWPNVYKSSEWPLFTTTKDYFCIYSSDHMEGNSIAGTYWGEMDSPEFDNFTERGVIVSGSDEPETPWLIKSTSAISGIGDTYFLYYSHYSGGTNNGFDIQQTKLITTSGGAALHLCTWDDKGYILGLGPTEQHTGYLRVWGPPDRLIGNHLTNGNRGISPLAGSAVSESTDGGLTFSRLHSVPVNDFPVDGYISDKLQKCVFEYNGIKFAFITLYTFPEASSDSRIILAEVDDEFLPVFFVQTICEKSEYTRTINLYIENNIAYLYIKSGGGISNDDKAAAYKIYKFKLSELAGYISFYDPYPGFRLDTTQFMRKSGVKNTTETYFAGTDQENTGVDIWNAVEGFMSGLDSALILSKMVAMYPMVGGTASAHKLNLVNTFANDIKWLGTWAHLPTGAKPDGLVGTSGNTRVIPSDNGDLNHLSIYTRENIVNIGPSVVDPCDAGSYNPGLDGRTYLSAKMSPTNQNMRACNTKSIINSPMVDARGFYIVSKQTSILTKIFKNGVLEKSSADTGTMAPSSYLHIAARGGTNVNDLAYNGSHSNRELSFVSFGTQLSDVEQSTFYDLVQALQVALKREV